MSVFRFPPLLDIAAWEAAFADAADPAGPPVTTGGGRLHLDFSRVEWVDFGVLARALLLLDAAIRAGGAATVTLPVREPSRVERAAVEAGGDGPDRQAAERRVRHRAGRRWEALTFMRQAGFERALETAHWPDDALAVHRSGPDLDESPARDPRPGIGSRAGESADMRNPRQRRILPLRWVKPLAGRELRESTEFAAVETGLRDLGVSAPDARAISQTVFAELLENVARHGAAEPSCAPRALLGAMLLDPAFFRAQRPNLLIRPDELIDLDAAGGRLLRALVCDSGAVARGPAGLSSDPARTIVNAIESLATAQGTAERESGIGGLRTVARVVRSYQGSVTARTGGMSASLVFSDGEEGVGSVHEEAGRMPGTLFEALVVIDPRSFAADAPWQAHPAAPRDLDLAWIGCSLAPDHGLSPGDREAFAQETDRARAAGAERGVLVTLPSGQQTGAGAGTYQQALRRTLEILSRGAERTAVAAVFPDTSRHLLDLHATQLYPADDASDADDEAGGSPHPVLVFGSHGRPLWYGGCLSLRRVLEALTASDGVMPTALAREHWVSGRGDEAEFETALRDARHLVSMQDDSVLLLLSPLTVLGSLLRTAQHVLSSEIARGGSGVERGLFRTPSLALVDRWIDVAVLVESTLGFDFTAFALARAAEVELGRARAARLGAVAQAATCPAPLAASLSECLGLRGSYYPMESELDQDGWNPPELPEDADVVLCADAILTENTVRRAAAAVARHAAPTLIVCILDGRRDRGPIRVLNREIPVVALARVDLTPPFGRAPGRPVANIDPILRCATPPRIDEPRAVDDEELLDLCGPAPGAQSGALRLGHIKSKRHMHFTANIRIEWLMRRADARERIVHAMADEVRRAFDELDRMHGPMPGDPGPLELRYPGGADDDPGELALEVLAELRDSGLPVVGPVRVHRFAAGAAWQARPPASPSAKRVAIIDLGVVTGTTIVQLVRDAALGGAGRVVVVPLVDQLPESDPGFLGMIRAVSGPAGAADVPAMVRFVSRCAIGGFEAKDCPACATRSKYADIGNAPSRLREHARRLCEVLAPRRREEIFETVPADMFNAPIPHTAATDVLRWRRLLVRALRDTAARQSLLDRLTGLNAGGTRTEWTQRGLIRLLAAEQQWLKLPPLRFAVCREQLARVCQDELARPAPEPIWLRVQALMVLAVAAPADFVRLLPRLLALAADEQIVVDQLLLDCYRLVRRPSHDTPVGIEQLRSSLIRCRDYLENSQAGWDHKLMEDYVQVVRQLIFLVYQPSQPLGGSVQAAWAGLREDWCRPVEQHHFESRLLRVRDFVEVLRIVGPDHELARAAESDWEACARSVGERAVVYLPRLRPILTGDYVGEVLGPRAQRSLVELSRTDSTMLPALADQLHSLIKRPWKPDDAAWRAEWRDVLERFNWWHVVFFATHRPKTESPALLVDLLRSTPCSVKEVLESVTAALGVAFAVAEGVDLDVRVFCPRALLYEVVEHVIKNARRHRDGDAAKQRFEVGLSRPGVDAVSVAVRNTVSSARPTPGNGLAELDRSLRPFEGSLAARPLWDGEWTFEAVISLQLWRED